MADETTTTAAPVDAPTSAPAAPAQAETDETTTTAANGDAAASKENGEAAGTAEPAATEGHTAQEGAESASADPAAASTPASGSKDKKRKSTGGVPEHKGKKTPAKRKSMPANLHLDAKPGEFFWARLKGYPPWPSVICDESMLPEVLLASRPVSTARPDGTIREDFLEGGKNAKDRTYPIMFLATNEFIWMNNTLLTPLDPEECKTMPTSKMTKALQSAYQIASENHDLEYFKDLLATWQSEVEAARKADAEAEELERQLAEQAAEAEANGAEAAAPPKKKAPRKSKAADDDAELDEAGAAPKSTKKRKKTDESEGDAPKAKKTPKVTKLNGPKTPSDASAKKEKKPKKKVVSAPKVEEQDDSKPELTPEEKLQQREKSVLYLRHRLQKGFLSRDAAPQESEMDSMGDFFNQLEAYTELEPSIIRTTKIHKVLKAIVKLASVPKDDQFQFKKRSTAMLEIWNKRMESENDALTSAAAPMSESTEAKAPETNGTAGAKDVEMKDAADGAAAQIEEKAEGKADAVDDLPAAPTEKVADLAEAAKEEAAAPADGDVSMDGAAA